MRNVHITLAAGLCLAGCSPYVYKDEINSFTGSVATIATTAAGSRTAIDEINAARRLESWAGGSRAVVVTGKCDVSDVLGSSVCGVIGPDPDRPSQMIAIDAPDAKAPQLDHVKPILTELDAYTAALKALTNAADREAFDKASEALQKQLGKLKDALGADALDKVQAAAIDKVPAVLGYAIGLYLDQRRYEALRTYVPAADPAVAKAAAKIGPALDQLARLRMRRLAATIRAESRAYNVERARVSAADNELRLQRLAENVAAYKATSAFDWKKFSTSLTDAHAALANAVLAGAHQDTAVLKAMRDFATQVQAAYEAIAKAESGK